MHNVFLSYSRDDRARAKTVAAALEKAGMTVWWDRRLAAGSEYSKEIEQALQNAAAVVVLWSRSSVDSPWVRDEAGKGRDSGRLVPATLDGTEPPLGFGQFHTIDLFGRRWSQGPLTELVGATAEKLREAGAEPAAPPTSAGAVPAAKTLPVRPAVIGLACIAVLMAAGYLLYGFLSAPEPDDARGGKVAIAGFQPLSNDPQSRRIAQLASGAVERTFATNFIETFTADAASTDALAGADFSLRGTVDSGGEDVTILVSVVEPGSGRTLWSTEVTRDARESRELTEELAIFVADVIRCSAYTQRRMPNYNSEEVRSRILRSCEAERSGTRQYEQLAAVAEALAEVAPESAQAWAYVANATAFLYPDRLDRAMAAADKALKLDPDNGAVRWGLAVRADRDLTLAERERLLLEGLRLDPEFLWFRNHLGHVMRQVGRTENALKWYREFVSNYPLDHLVRVWGAYLQAQLGAMPEARLEFERVAELRPWFKPVRIYAIRAEILDGDPARARRWLEGGNFTEQDERCVELLIRALGARQQLSADEIERHCLVDTEIFQPAQLFAKFGHNDRVIATIADAGASARARTTGPAHVYESVFAPIRADPRFIPLLVPWGIPQYWLETNKWPDFCREDTLPYDCREAAAAAVSAAGVRR